METIVSTSYLYPQSVISNGQTTGNEWQDPDNILVVDNETANSYVGQSSDIVVGNFNFNLPQNAVVTGIEFKVRGYAGAVTSPLTSLTFYAVDNTSGRDIFYPYSPVFTGLTTAMDFYDFGSSTYTFATSFTPDQMNNLKLQIIASDAAYIDAVAMKVHYYIESSTEPEPAPEDEQPSYQAPLQATPFFLSRPLNADDTVMYLQSMNYPNGSAIQVPDLGGGFLDLTIDPGVQLINAGDAFEENVRTAFWEEIDTGEIKVTFGEEGDPSLDYRGLDYRYGYGDVAGNRSLHLAGSKVIITANAPFLQNFIRRGEANAAFSVPIVIKDEGVEKTASLNEANFVGAGVSVTVPDPMNAPHDIQINIPGVGGATTPVFAGSASGTSGSSQVTSLAYDLEVSGTDRTAIINVYTQQTVTVTDVTVGGVSATVIHTEADAVNNLRVSQYRITAPALGTQEVEITLSGIAYVSSDASVWASTDQSSPIGDSDTDNGSSNAPTVGLSTTVSYSTTIVAVGTEILPIVFTPGAGQTEIETENNGMRQGASSYEYAGSSPDSVTLDYSITQNTPWVIAAIELKGLVITPILTGLTVEDEGVPVESDVSDINFTGNRVVVTSPAPNQVDVTINEPDPIVRTYTILKANRPSNLTTPATTQYDITNPVGTTMRVTFDGTGTDPNINSGTVTVGQVVQIQAQNFNAANKGTFLVTGVGANFFEVTNAAVVPETNKTVGTGYIAWNNTWIKPIGLKYITVEMVGGSGGSGGADASSTNEDAGSGASAAAYGKKLLLAAALASTELVVVGVRGPGGTELGGDGVDGTASTFGSLISVEGGKKGAGTAGGNQYLPVPGGSTVTGADVSVPGGPGFPALGVLNSAIQGGNGGNSMLGFGGVGGNSSVLATTAFGYGSGPGGAFSNNGATAVGIEGLDGIVIITEYY